jgi:hypothetical protein
VDGTIAPEDFANKLNALVKAQTAVLAVFTIRRDKASTVWGETPDGPARASLSDTAVLVHRAAALVGGRGG